MKMTKKISYEDTATLENSQERIVISGIVRFEKDDAHVEFVVKRSASSESVVLCGRWNDVSEDMEDFSEWLSLVLAEKNREKPKALSFRSKNRRMLASFMPSKTRDDAPQFGVVSFIESSVGKIGVRRFLLDVDDEVGNAFNLILDSLASIAVAVKDDINVENEGC